MSDDLEDNATLIRAETRRNWRFKLSMMGLAIGAALLAFGLALNMDSSPQEHRIAVVAWMVGGGITAIMAGLLWRWRPNAESRRLEGLNGHRDRVQRARSQSLVTLPFSLLMMTAVSTSAVWRMRQGGGDHTDWIGAALIALVVWLPLMILMGWHGGDRSRRKFMEDEFIQALRGRALALGYVVMLAGLTGLYLVGLWRPQWMMVAFPAVLAVGAIAPGLRFALLDRAAERGDD